MVEPIEAFEGSFGGIPVVTHETAHHIPIFLLHVTTIILLVGAGPGEGNFLVLAILIEALVDEFAAIIRVHTKQGKRKTLPHVVDGLTHPLLPFTPHW
jgi:hypothetical protein